jgi:hypothetical protein
MSQAASGLPNENFLALLRFVWRGGGAIRIVLPTARRKGLVPTKACYLLQKTRPIPAAQIELRSKKFRVTLRRRRIDRIGHNRAVAEPDNVGKLPNYIRLAAERKRLSSRLRSALRCGRPKISWLN